jgi:hypothetical protein
MAVVLNPVIENNLFVKSILSSELDFADATHGENNKKTLSNRVKKLTPIERQELMDGLNEISSRINPPNAAPQDTVTPLKERALSTFVLLDDGTKAEDHFFLVSFFYSLQCLFGARVSSDAILNKLSETRTLLDGKGYRPHTNPVDAEVDLNAQILVLEQKLRDTPNPADKINPLLSKLEAIGTTFQTASQNDWTQPATFAAFRVALAQFKKEIGDKVPEAQAKVDEAITFINTILSDRKTKNLQQLSTILRDQVIPFYMRSPQFKNLMERYRGKLDAISRGEQRPGFDEKFWEKNLIIPYITSHLGAIKWKLQSIISSFESEKLKTETELETLRGRLAKYRENSQKSLKRGEFVNANSNIAKVRKELNNYTQICAVIDSSIELISHARAQGLESVKDVVNIVHEDFGYTDGELKATDHFGQHLQFFKEFSADFVTKKQDIADALDKLASLNGAIDAPSGLYDRLSRFKSDPNAYLLNSDEEKTNFINDYFAYWKFTFDKSKQNKGEELETAKTTQERIAAELNPPKSPEPMAPRPVAPLYPPVVVTDVLPSELVIPTGGNAHLTAIARGLQTNRSNPSTDGGWYAQAVSGTFLPEELIQKVYGNFYWIMRDAGKLCGELENGHAKDRNWGGKVFTTGTVNGIVPSVDRPLLNHYRVQAMVEVLQNRIRTSAL